MTPTNKNLRFAPLVRVSSEGQTGEMKTSLENQKSKIIKAVEDMGGSIPDHCWIYTGNEHATPGYEKSMYQQLLKDSEEDLWDAVIISDHDRWSRDNLDGETGLRTLHKNGKLLFVRDQQQDLTDPTIRTQLSLFTVFAQHVAALQKMKSQEGKIAMARLGIPSSGRLPYGRLFDREKLKVVGKQSAAECWSIDNKKAELFRHCAQRYADGDNPGELAALLGITQYTFTQTMRYKSGDTWHD